MRDRTRPTHRRDAAGLGGGRGARRVADTCAELETYIHDEKAYTIQQHREAIVELRQQRHLLTKMLIALNLPED